jgi:hypothetical protein
MTAQILAFPLTPTLHAKARVAQGRNQLALWQPRCNDWVQDLETGRPLRLLAFTGYPDRVVQWSAWCPITRLSVLRSPHDILPLPAAAWPQDAASGGAA